MAVSGNISTNSGNYGSKVNMDIWTWCAWCGVREWFKHVYDNKYRCAHCKNELEIKNTNVSDYQGSAPYGESI
jgi:hypothetical protein